MTLCDNILLYLALFDVMWCQVVSCGVMGVMWRYVVLSGDMWRYVALRGVLWRYVTLCDVM